MVRIHGSIELSFAFCLTAGFPLTTLSDPYWTDFAYRSSHSKCEDQRISLVRFHIYSSYSLLS